jgi:hypothetical protein
LPRSVHADTITQRCSRQQAAYLSSFDDCFNSSLRFFNPVKHVAFLFSLWCATCLAGTEIEPGFRSIFNGKDLSGWEGKPGWWTVEDGAITSQSTKEKPCDAAHYLMWRGGKPGDFELRMEFKLAGAGGNSGIQFRSREVPNWDTSGYQADLENGEQWTGCLFEHARGGVAMREDKVVIEPSGKKQVTPLPGTSGAELLKVFKRERWNSYTVIARGPDITLKINDVVMCQAIDNQEGMAARDGIIALQMHPGPPMKIQFRNLRTKSLNSKSN